MTKTFDCVKMKRDAQRHLRAEYEVRKDEFSSYVDFLKAKSDESGWARKSKALFRQVRSF